MLTHKQNWRKSKVRKLSLSQIARRTELEYERSKNQSLIIVRDKSIIGESQQKKNVVVAIDAIKKKYVRFSSTVFVLLIPNRHEISSYSTNLYWSDENYATFKKEAVDEIRAVLAAKKITAKEAIQFLYQPVHPIYDDDFKSSVNKPNSTETVSVSSAAPETTSVIQSSTDSTQVGGDVDGDMFFIMRTKTDLELNKEAEDEDSREDKEHARPHRTPSGAASNSTMWAVQWRKAAIPS